jgi:PAS domain S-box-containing protein
MIVDLPQLWSDEERWQVLMDHVKDYGIFMLDAIGRIATWNIGAERLLGYSSEEAIGQPFQLIFTEPDVAQEQPEFEMREAKDKGRCEDERWHVRSDGSTFWASGVLTPLWAPDGTLRGFAKVVRDITERKLAELATAEANRRKDEFLAILSHEFRNPLGAIVNGARLIQMDTSTSTMVQDAALIVLRQAETLTHMVEDLLDISRISGGKLQVNRQRVKLADVLRHAIDAAEPMIDSRKHLFVYDPPPESVWIDGDPHRLQQVFSNILVNAAKFTDVQGRIELSVLREGNVAKIQIADNGPGIVSEMLPRIFEPFVQADRSVERSHGGLGIGLSLVKRLVEIHGGRVEALSEGIGKGSQFVVQLPIIAEIEKPSPDQPSNTLTPSKAGLRVLIAEDNADTAKTMAMILQKFNHEVSIVRTGRDVLLVDTNQFDVAILDIGLPGMDGYQVAAKLIEKGRPRLLIAITGYAMPEDIAKSLQSGFDHHLVKPVDFAALLAILDSLAKSED